MNILGVHVPFTKFVAGPSDTPSGVSSTSNQPPHLIAPSQSAGNVTNPGVPGVTGDQIAKANIENARINADGEGEPVNTGRKAVYDGPSMARNPLGGPDYPFDQFETILDQVIAGDLNAKDLQSNILERNLDLWAGIEVPYMNPDEFLREKHKTIRFYDIMLRDDRIKSVTELKKRMILSVPCNIVPASDSDEDIAIAEDIKTQLHGLTLGEVHTPLKDIMDNFLDAHYYGFKCGEKIWGYNKKSKRIYLKSIKLRHSIFFDPIYDHYKNLRGMWIGRYFGGHKQVVGKAFSEKFMLFTHPYIKDGNAYGESDLRGIFPQFRAKVKIFNFRNERLEGWGKPIPVATYDRKLMDSREISELDEQLQRFQNKKSFMIPGNFDKASGKLVGIIQLDFQEARVGTGGKDDAYNAAIDQLDTQISRHLLVPDKLGITESAGGSYALGKTQFDWFLSVVEREHDKLEALFKPLIKQMVDYNYDVKAYPRMEFDNITNRMEAKFLEVLIANKVVDPREHWIRQFSGIPELSKQEKEELASSPRPTPDKADTAITTKHGHSRAPASFKSKRTPPVNFKEISEHLNSTEDEFLTLYAGTFKEIKDYLIRQIKNKKIIENKDLEAARNLKINKGDLKDLIQSCLAKLYVLGKSDSIKETKPRFKALKHKVEFKVTFASLESEKDWLNRDFIKKYMSQHDEWGTITAEDAEYLKQIKDIAFQSAGDIEDRLIKNIFQKLSEGFRADLGVDAILTGITAAIQQEEDRYKVTTFRTASSTAYNEGRSALFDSPEIAPMIEAYEYSAIIDDATSPFCDEHNGQIILKTDPILASITPPNHFNAVLPDTKVICLEGEKNIQDVCKGDFVRTHTGKFRKVYDAMMEHRDEDIYTIEIENGQRLRVTHDHPVMTSSGWVNAGDLKEGMEVFYFGNKTRISYCKHCGNEIMQKGKKKNRLYCSQSCMSKAMRKYENQKCLKCGKELISTWKKPYAKGRRFCNTACYFSYKGRTKIEEVVAKSLTSLGVDFVEQYKIGKYFADFMLPHHNIVIEADGNYWHDKKERIGKPERRDLFLASQGYRVYHLGQDAILGYKLEQELSKILGVKNEADKNKINQ